MNIADMINKHADAVGSHDSSAATRIESDLKKFAKASGVIGDREYSSWYMKNFIEHRVPTYFSNTKNISSALTPQEEVIKSSLREMKALLRDMGRPFDVSTDGIRAAVANQPFWMRHRTHLPAAGAVTGVVVAGVGLLVWKAAKGQRWTNLVESGRNNAAVGSETFSR